MVPMFNGILFMTSQSPFTSQDYACKIWTNKKAGTNDYVDYGIRMAHAFSPNLPQKLTLPICAVQIGATNYDDKTNVGRDRSHVNYDGINVYGDEVTTNIKGVAAGLLCRRYQSVTICCFNSIPPNYNVSRTGYNEVDLTDNKASTPRSIFSLQAIC
jgi:hypothetical protein